MPSPLYIVESIPRWERDPVTGVKFKDLGAHDQHLLTRSGLYARLVATRDRVFLFPFRKVRVRKV